MIRTLIRSLRRARARRRELQHERFRNTSYAQEGEDQVLLRHFGPERLRHPGFYVDVGAHHPFRFSNTYAFYRLGWRGINIDANPDSIALFCRARPRDINIAALVSDAHEPQTYYEFNEPALNGCDTQLSLSRDGYEAYRITRQLKLATVPLANILDSHLPKGTPIDFLTVDVEGHDLQVLRSLDITRHRPLLIAAEDAHATDLAATLTCSIAQYLKAYDFEPFAKTNHTIFFVDRRYR